MQVMHRCHRWAPCVIQCTDPQCNLSPSEATLLSFHLNLTCLANTGGILKVQATSFSRDLWQQTSMQHITHQRVMIKATSSELSFLTVTLPPPHNSDVKKAMTDGGNDKKWGWGFLRAYLRFTYLCYISKRFSFPTKSETLIQLSYIYLHASSIVQMPCLWLWKMTCGREEDIFGGFLKTYQSCWSQAASKCHLQMTYTNRRLRKWKRFPYWTSCHLIEVN